MVESITVKKITVLWDVTPSSLVKILGLSEENAVYTFREVEQ
jgi:hypothetical protein